MGAGIILFGAGFSFLPLGGSSNPKALAFNSTFPFLVVQGIFSRPGLVLMVLGVVFILIASVLPKK